MTGVQILKYMALQWLELQEQHMLISGKLPPIIPVVIYQGQENTRKMNPSFHDLVEMPSEAFKIYIPDFSFAFFNVRGIDEANVQEKILLKFYVEIIKMQNDPNIREFPSRLVRGLLESLEQRTALEYIDIFFRYLVKSSGYLSQEDYKKALELLPEGGEKIMETLADQWLRQGEDRGVIIGKQEGLVEGKRESVIKAANSRLGIVQPDTINRIKSIESLEVLDALFDFSLRAETMDQFTDQVRKITDN